MRYLKIIFSFFIVCIFPIKSQILFSEYAEGSSYNKYLEIYNYSPTTINLNEYAFPSCSNGCDTEGEWDYMNYFPEGASVNPGEVYVITHPYATDPDNDYYTEEIAIYSDHQFTYLSNGDDVFSLINIESGAILDIIGAIGPDPGSGWDVAGVANATKDHTLVRKNSVITGNTGDWVSSAGTTVNDSEWIVFDNETWDNLGAHNYDSNNIIVGCMCPEAMNYNSDANLDDGSCMVENGCSDPSALNYSGLLCDFAEFIDEACEYEVVLVSGCYWCELAINYFDFNYQITSSNMTIAITDISNLLIGDIVGVFYIDSNGFITCGGSIIFEGDQMAVAAWGDDPSTEFVDGFQSGNSFIFLVLRDGIVYELEVSLNNLLPFNNTYGDNTFGQVTEMIVGNEFVEECMLPLGVGADCDQFFTISENKNDKQLVFTIDMLGRIVQHDNYYGIGFHVYNDGTIEKKYFSNH